MIKLLLVLMLPVACFGQNHSSESRIDPIQWGKTEIKGWFYTVSWVLTEPSACPDYKQDKFGRWPNTVCAAYHTAQVKHSRDFLKKPEAVSFFKECELEFGKGKCNLDSADIAPTHYIDPKNIEMP